MSGAAHKEMPAVAGVADRGRGRRGGRASAGGTAADTKGSPPLAEIFIARAEAAIADERARQRRRFDAAHDDRLRDRQLFRAANCYFEHGIMGLGDSRPKDWPFRPAEWRPGTAERDLIRAGALFQAEVERIERDLAPRNCNPAGAARNMLGRATHMLAMLYRDRTERVDQSGTLIEAEGETA
jgi:hypothetical protein